LAELLIRRSHFGHVARLHRAAKPGARVSDGDEYRVFLFRDPLDGLHQIGDQIGAALELGLNLPLCLVDPFVQRLNRVVAAPRYEQE
jgi:hypothetical protein